MLIKNDYKKIVPLLFFLTPLVSFAQSAPQNLNDILNLFIDVIYVLIPILIGVAVLLFIWGLFRYYSTDNQNTKKEAVKIIGYGVVAIFVMVSIWGLVNLIIYTLNINSPTSGPGTFPVNTINVKQEVQGIIK
jgi:heme/copper-type cytochrome/quinol oxidase subunit 2